ncbi:MAG: PrsW family glutamic-type intramembrane protease [Bacteroidales bacterium]
MVIKLLVSLIPVLLLLLTLLYFDSLKLVKRRLLMICLIWGVASAGLSYIFNTFLIKELNLSYEDYSGFIAPVVEETLKFLVLWYLIRKHKVGFMIDGAVYGFAIGAAFSFIENLFYLFIFSSDESYFIEWIIRGFGTAIMHGGATSIMGILCMGALNRQSGLTLATLLGGFSAIVLHGSFNQFLVYPVLATTFILLITPLSIFLIFTLNEKTIRNWLDLEFDSEVKMLKMIRKGMFSKTKTGSFLVSIKTYFPPEVVVDIYCFISLYLELSIKAKSLILLQEAGISLPGNPSVMRQLAELKALKKNIGRGGYLAIAPILKMTPKDLWKLSLLSGT